MNYSLYHIQKVWLFLPFHFASKSVSYQVFRSQKALRTKLDFYIYIRLVLSMEY